MTKMLQRCPSSISFEDRLFDNFDLLTIEQLSEILGKKPQTIRNWVARREIPFLPGRPVKFLRSSILAWLKHKEVKPCR